MWLYTFSGFNIVSISSIISCFQTFPLAGKVDSRVHYFVRGTSRSLLKIAGILAGSCAHELSPQASSRSGAQSSQIKKTTYQLVPVKYIGFL